MMTNVRTKADYAAYERNVKDFITREELSFLSTSCREIDDLSGDGDPWFSWSPCECCGSPLGGNREYLYARNAADEVAQFIICEDCVYYINYGRLDDTTMQEIERSAV